MTETYTVTIEPLDREVECAEDQPILDACLRAGVWLPHACTHGTCGTCKLQVLDGDVEHNDSSDFALMEFERNEGKALICVATPTSDVTLEADVEIEEGVTYHPVNDYRGTLVELTDIARETRRLIIELDAPMAFNPGQYVTLEVPGQGVTRTYSMANPPSEPNRIELQIRRTPGGLGTDGWIFKDLAVGDEINISGPYGRFFLREARAGAGHPDRRRHRAGPAQVDHPARPGAGHRAAALPLPGRPRPGRPLRRGVLPRSGGAVPGPVHLPPVPLP